MEQEYSRDSFTSPDWLEFENNMLLDLMGIKNRKKQRRNVYINHKKLFKHFDCDIDQNLDIVDYLTSDESVDYLYNNIIGLKEYLDGEHELESTHTVFLSQYIAASSFIPESKILSERVDEKHKIMDIITEKLNVKYAKKEEKWGTAVYVYNRDTQKTKVYDIPNPDILLDAYIEITKVNKEGEKYIRGLYKKVLEEASGQPIFIYHYVTESGIRIPYFLLLKENLSEMTTKERASYHHNVSFSLFEFYQKHEQEGTF